MAHHRPSSSAWPSQSYQLDMYDDQPYPEDRNRSSLSQSHQIARKDHERTPPRGDAYSERHWRGRSRSPSREHRRGHTSQHDGGYNRSRSRSPNHGVTPNRTVILDGTMDLTQEDILNELQQRLQIEGIEEIRLIKDRRTGQSRQFAFAQFVGISEAKQFLDQYYPTVHLYCSYDPTESGNMESVKVRIAYSREKEDREKNGKSDDDWKCEVCHVSNFSHRNLCFRCNAPRTRSTANGIVIAQANMSSHSGFMTTGESDASPDGTASQFILIRGLEPGTNEEHLAKGVSKLYKTKPPPETIDSRINKKTKISSTTNDASLGAKEGSLRRVLLVRDRRSGDSWRYGFAEFNTVDDAQAAMAKFKASEKFTISSKPVLVSSIHSGVFVPVLHPMDEESTKFTFSPLSNAAIRLMYWDEAAYASELVIAADETSTTLKSNENEHARLAAAAQNEGLLGAGRDGEPKLKKRKVEKDSKVVAPHLQFWTNQHAELHGKPAKEGTATNIALSDAGTTEALETTSSQSFADLERKCCFLCLRQFKTEAEVNKHERMSQLHRDNLKNNELVTKALVKLNRALDTGVDNSAYRDRAKERRKVFNQPKQPSTQHNRPPKDEQPEEDSLAPIQSKGAALLGKMGWSAGEGLGAKGNGRTEAITPNIFMQGVGLGAPGGKAGDAAEEAQRQTKGSYTDFLNRTKEKAKERFDSLE